MLPRGTFRFRSLLPVLLLLPLLHLGCSSDSGGGPAVPATCDVDEDGYLSDIAGCDGDDCDDLDPEAFPGATEECFGDTDNDCDGFHGGDDADCAELVLSLQDGAPTSVLSNVVEYCHDMVHVQIDHHPLVLTASQPILDRITVTYSKAIPSAQGNCPASPLGTTFNFPIPVDGELLINNIAIVHQQHKLTELRMPPYPVACIATITATARTESGDAFEVEPLRVPFTVESIAHRNPPCPSQR